MKILHLGVMFLVVLGLVIGYTEAQDRILFREDHENIADEYSPKNVKIPEKMLIRLKDVRDTTEFLNKFVQTYMLATEIPNIYGRRPMKSAPAPTVTKLAICEPEEKVVELEKPTNAAVLFWPSCVRVRRCGGCCPSTLLSCKATATSILNVTVLQVFYNPQTPDVFENQGTNVFSLEQHDRCACKCRQNASNCTARQQFREEECRCVCTNQEESYLCSGPKRIWDISECACKCRKVLDCSTGSYFNPLKCRCETSRSLSTLSVNRRFLISN